jgi:hypothetical protein
MESARIQGQPWSALEGTVPTRWTLFIQLYTYYAIYDLFFMYFFST